MDPKETIARLRRLESARREAAVARAAALRMRLPAAAALLRAHGARRVVLFGSLAVGRPSLSSDVDLAVEGLPGNVYFTALADAAALLAARVDLVRLEECPASLRARIDDEGEPL